MTDGRPFPEIFNKYEKHIELEQGMIACHQNLSELLELSVFG